MNPSDLFSMCSAFLFFLCKTLLGGSNLIKTTKTDIKRNTKGKQPLC